MISKRSIDAVLRESVWDIGNRVLYDLCQKYPEHKRDDEIIAKVWLIGRSYAAAIERRRNADPNDGEFYEKTVGPKLRKSHLDCWLDTVPKRGNPGSAVTLVVHKKLVDLFMSMTDLEKRSLASKYLHFHRPGAFFIYDSRARAAITKFVPRLNKLPDIASDDCDEDYKNFVRRCMWLCEVVHSKYKVSLTPRQLDGLLLQ